jgi:hypothetical protein
VKQLLWIYHEAVRSVKDPDVLLIFIHQDVTPIISTAEIDLFSVTANNSQKFDWFLKALNNPLEWWETIKNLAFRANTGIIGVAGSLGLLPETAWWCYPDLSGAVIHLLPDNKIRLNLYGPYGRVALLDGVCLMFRRGMYDLLSEPAKLLDGFHFYDMDLSLRAHLAGLKNWTVPLLLMHKSGGADINDKSWKEEQKKFLSAYKSYLPIIVPFEPLPLA